MKEKQTEQKLVKAVRAAGGLCPKWISPGWNGVPDRMVLLPGGVIGFVEVKAPGKKPRPLQSLRLNQLLALGFPICVLDDPDQIPCLLDQLINRLAPKGSIPTNKGAGRRGAVGRSRAPTVCDEARRKPSEQRSDATDSSAARQLRTVGRPESPPEDPLLVAPQGEIPV